MEVQYHPYSQSQSQGVFPPHSSPFTCTALSHPSTASQANTPPSPPITFRPGSVQPSYSQDLPPSAGGAGGAEPGAGGNLGGYATTKPLGTRSSGSTTHPTFAPAEASTYVYQSIPPPVSAGSDLGVREVAGTSHHGPGFTPHTSNTSHIPSFPSFDTPDGPATYHQLSRSDPATVAASTDEPGVPAGSLPLVDALSTLTSGYEGQRSLRDPSNNHKGAQHVSSLNNNGSGWSGLDGPFSKIAQGSQLAPWNREGGILERSDVGEMGNDAGMISDRQMDLGGPAKGMGSAGGDGSKVEPYMAGNVQHTQAFRGFDGEIQKEQGAQGAVTGVDIDSGDLISPRQGSEVVSMQGPGVVGCAPDQPNKRSMHQDSVAMAGPPRLFNHQQQASSSSFSDLTPPTEQHPNPSSATSYTTEQSVTLHLPQRNGVTELPRQSQAPAASLTHRTPASLDIPAQPIQAPLVYAPTSAITNPQPASGLLPPPTAIAHGYLSQNMSMLPPSGAAPSKLFLPAKKPLPTPPPKGSRPGLPLMEPIDVDLGVHMHSNSSSSSAGSDVTRMDIDVQIRPREVDAAATAPERAAPVVETVERQAASTENSEEGPVYGPYPTSQDALPPSATRRKPSVPIPPSLPYSSVTPPISRNGSPTEAQQSPESAEFGSRWRPFGAENAALLERSPDDDRSIILGDGPQRSRELEAALAASSQLPFPPRPPFMPPNQPGLGQYPSSSQNRQLPGQRPLGYILVPTNAGPPPYPSDVIYLPATSPRGERSLTDTKSLMEAAEAAAQAAAMGPPRGLPRPMHHLHRPEAVVRAAQRLNQLTVGANVAEFPRYGPIPRMRGLGKRLLPALGDGGAPWPMFGDEPPVGGGRMDIDDLPELEEFEDIKPSIPDIEMAAEGSPWSGLRKMTGGPLTPLSGSDTSSFWGSGVPLLTRATHSASQSHVRSTSQTHSRSTSTASAATTKKIVKGRMPANLTPEQQEEVKKEYDSRPHKCSECSLAFQRAHDLKRHFRLHTGEQPYKCPNPDCAMKYERNDQLRRHIDKTPACKQAAPSLTHYSFGTDRPKRRKTLVMNSLMKRKEQERAMASHYTIDSGKPGLTRIVRMERPESLLGRW